MEENREEKTDNDIERMRNLYNFDCCILLVLLILIIFKKDSEVSYATFLRWRSIYWNSWQICTYR